MKLEYFAEEEGGGTPIVLYQGASSAHVPEVKVQGTEDAAGACDSPEEEDEGTPPPPLQETEGFLRQLTS